MATGDGVDDFGACNGDGLVYCPMYYTPGVTGLRPPLGWEERAAAAGYTTDSAKLSLVECLGDHRDVLSGACVASLDRRAALNQELMKACARYCAGVTPGPGVENCVVKLEELDAEGKIDATCAERLRAHEGAKAR